MKLIPSRLLPDPPPPPSILHIERLLSYYLEWSLITNGPMASGAVKLLRSRLFVLELVFNDVFGSKTLADKDENPGAGHVKRLQKLIALGPKEGI